MGFWSASEGVGTIDNIADLAGAWPAGRITGRKKAKQTYNADADLFYSEPEVQGFRKKIFIPESGLVLITWRAKIQHRGINAGAPHGTEYPIGLGGRPMYRRATTEDGLSGSLSYINKGLSAGQIRDYTYHRFFTLRAARIPFAVDGGYWYQFSLSLGSHTDAGSMAGADGAAELSPSGNNFILLEYEPGKTIAA